MQQPLCCPSPPAAGFGERDAGSVAPGMQAGLGWGREPGDGLFFSLAAVLSHLGLPGW